MGCHTQIYKKIEDLTKNEYNRLRKKCEDEAYTALNDNTTLEELQMLYIKFYGYVISIDEIKKKIEKRKSEAKHFIENIDKDPSLMKIYILTYNYNDEEYFKVGTYDNFRIKTYIDDIFTTANDLIDYCKKHNWNNVYFCDDYRNRIKAKQKINDAKNIIKSMFTNKNIIVKFG